MAEVEYAVSVVEHMSHNPLVHCSTEGRFRNFLKIKGLQRNP